MAVEDEARQLDAVRITLEREFADRVPADVIARHFTAIVSAYEGVPVRTFLPVLVHRQAKALLTAAD